jgi:hypothetical protein
MTNEKLITKTYQFPNSKIVKTNGNFYEMPNWCPYLTIERDRTYVRKALKMLRAYRRGELR